jgi:GT2 family glycosyltransferase
VGANAVGAKTAQYLRNLRANGEIDHLIHSRENLNKCPMMREMFRKVQSEFIWWFDDDSYIQEKEACERWLGAAEQALKSTVMWGQMAYCDSTMGFAPNLADVVAFVRSASWYRGLPPPSWKPGGKGHFDFEGNGLGDGRWIFILGGCWLIRTSTIRALDWPDQRLQKEGDDVFLGEAIRQNGWTCMNIGTEGVEIDSEPRRGCAGAVE